MSLSPAGVLQGPATASSSAYSFSVKVTDSLNNSATQALSLVVNFPPSIFNTSVNQGEQGIGYMTMNLQGYNGTAPLTWSAPTSGPNALPPGLTLSPTGTLSGTPTVTGSNTPISYTPRITLTDANGATASISPTLTVYAPITNVTSMLPPADQGAPGYSAALTASGGMNPQFFWLSGLPPGNYTASTNGTIAGTIGGSGTYMIQVHVIDNLGGSVYQTVTLNVNAPPSINSATLSQGDQGFNYPPQQLVASNGTPPYSNWSVSSNSLPPGLNLNPSTGSISGTPTGTGNYSFSVTVRDALGVTSAAQNFSIQVNLPPSFVNLPAAHRYAGPSLPSAPVGSSYSYSIPFANGTSPFTWTEKGALPAGLNFSNGTISGMATGGSFSPYDAGTWSTSNPPAPASSTVTGDCLATVTLQDALGGTAIANYPITSTPTSSCLTFQYLLDNGMSSGASGTWTFQNMAASSSTVSFDYRFTGSHAFFQVVASLQVFSGASTSTLYSAGPANCCSTPSVSFDVAGHVDLFLTATQPFGFTITGSNGDSSSFLSGYLTITNLTVH
jgi:hypothetical protein